MTKNITIKGCVSPFIWDESLVTIASNKYSKGNSVILRDALFQIPQRKKYQNKLHEVWGLSNSPTLQEAAKKKLPVWFPGGEFAGKHSLNERLSFSRLICIDIDAKDNEGMTAEEMKQALSGWISSEGVPYVAYAGLSCRRQGVFALVVLPDNACREDMYKKYCNAIAAELYKKFGIVIDPKSANPAQPRFLSYDEKPIYNPNPQVWRKRKRIAKKQSQFNPVCCQHSYTDETAKSIERVVSEMEQRNLVVFNTQTEWWQCAIALIMEFGYAGKDWFVRISNVWSRATGRNHSTEPEAFYLSQMKKHYRTDIGFIFNKAKKAGI